MKSGSVKMAKAGACNVALAAKWRHRQWRGVTEAAAKSVISRNGGGVISMAISWQYGVIIWQKRRRA
jgi:hypothetical protein